MTEGHYAVRAEDFNRLVAERDASRAEAARLRDALAKVAHEAVDAPHARQIAADALDAEDGDDARRALDAALDALDMVPRDMLDSMEEDYRSERERAEAAEAEAARLRDALIYIGYSAVGLHPGDPEAMRKIARAALTAEDGDE